MFAPDRLDLRRLGAPLRFAAYRRAMFALDAPCTSLFSSNSHPQNPARKSPLRNKNRAHDDYLFPTGAASPFHLWLLMDNSCGLGNHGCFATRVARYRRNFLLHCFSSAVRAGSDYFVFREAKPKEVRRKTKIRMRFAAFLESSAPDFGSRKNAWAPSAYYLANSIDQSASRSRNTRVSNGLCAIP
jgi:hypothetical protein